MFTVYDLDHEPPITPAEAETFVHPVPKIEGSCTELKRSDKSPASVPAETVVNPVPDTAATPNYFVCILMDTAI